MNSQNIDPRFNQMNQQTAQDAQTSTLTSEMPTTQPMTTNTMEREILAWRGETQTQTAPIGTTDDTNTQTQSTTPTTTEETTTACRENTTATRWENTGQQITEDTEQEQESTPQDNTHDMAEPDHLLNRPPAIWQTHGEDSRM